MIYSLYDSSVKTITEQLELVYAHGQLEDFLAHDMLKTDEHDIVIDFKAVRRGEKETAIIQTKAMNHNGDIISVDIYLWFNTTVRGLAVSLYDVDSRNYAEEMLKTKPAML
jgi:hypothetical protein